MVKWCILEAKEKRELVERSLHLWWSWQRVHHTPLANFNFSTVAIFVFCLYTYDLPVIDDECLC